MRILPCFVLCFTAAVGAAQAQVYPDKTKPVRMIVPSGAASTADLLARAYAKGIAEVSGLNVVVENKPGAETVIGVQALTSSQPDGYTMMLSSSSTNTLNVVMMPNLPYDPFKDFLPLVGVARASIVMNFSGSAPFKTAREFVSAAKAHPGKYTCASATATTRLGCDLLQSAAGIEVLNVPYKTTAAAVTALASGEVDVLFVDPSIVSTYWKSGMIRAGAVAGATRIPAFPDIPTLREQGVANLELAAWYATYFPAKVPSAVAATMRDILRRASRTKAVVDALNTFAMDELAMSGDELTVFNRREVQMYKKMLQQVGIKKE
jgi:tripartite-type tricarboxylate transporter receptor subunit TctC